MYKSYRCWKIIRLLYHGLKTGMTILQYLLSPIGTYLSWLFMGFEKTNKISVCT
jgi:hypothetical protein